MEASTKKLVIIDCIIKHLDFHDGLTKIIVNTSMLFYSYVVGQVLDH